MFLADPLTQNKSEFFLSSLQLILNVLGIGDGAAYHAPKVRAEARPEPR